MLERLALERLKKRYTHVDMAKALGTNVWNYSRIEKCEVSLSYEMAIKIAEIFGMKPDELFFEDFKAKKSSK